MEPESTYALFLESNVLIEIPIMREEDDLHVKCYQSQIIDRKKDPFVCLDIE